jgi:hypothetical protein
MIRERGWVFHVAIASKNIVAPTDFICVFFAFLHPFYGLPFGRLELALVFGRFFIIADHQLFMFGLVSLIFWNIFVAA